jgi:hypothetical protein
VLTHGVTPDIVQGVAAIRVIDVPLELTHRVTLNIIQRVAAVCVIDVPLELAYRVSLNALLSRLLGGIPRVGLLGLISHGNLLVRESTLLFQAVSV